MASPRLKKAHKIELHNAVLDAAAKERMETLSARENQLAKAIYIQIIKGHGKAIQSLPTGFVQKSDDIRVITHKTQKALREEKNGTGFKRTEFRVSSEEFHTINYGRWGSDDAMEIGEEVRMPHCYIHSAYHMLSTEGLGLELTQLIEEQEKLRDDLQTLSDTVKAALAQCTTVAKLVEHYPELKPYIPADIDINPLAVAHGKIEGLIECTKKATCEDDKPKRKKKAPGVIAL